MNKKISLGPAIALMAIVATITFVITFTFSMMNFNGKMRNLQERTKMYSKIDEIDRYVRQEFFGPVDEDGVMDAIANGYVTGLGDKYSVYMTAEEYSRQMQDYDGKTADIGVSTVKDSSGYYKIIEVYPESSAASAGLVAGDIIVKVGEEDLNLENSDRLWAAMKGEAGTKIQITIRRDNEDVAMEITRRKVEVPTVVMHQYDNVGYLQIKEFNNSTPEQFNRALDQLLGKGVKALVFDVRNNPGGTIDSVTAVLDRLLPEGDLVSATYKDGRTDVLAVSDSNEVNLPMVVITNSHSASAAELFAQAIKDYNKGRTVGTLTYGKGLMQTIYQLTDGSALSLTVAKYNPPKSENFDGVGVKADYEVKLTAEQEKVYYELDENSDPQLKKALELANAAIKTGGFDGLSETPPPAQEDNSTDEGDNSTSDEGETDGDENSQQDSSSSSDAA